MIDFKFNRFVLYAKSCEGGFTYATLTVVGLLLIISTIAVARYYSVNTSILSLVGAIFIIQKLSGLFSRKSVEIKSIKDSSDQLDITVLTPASEWEKYIYTYIISVVYIPILILVLWLGGGRFYSIHFDDVSSMFYMLDFRICLELGLCFCLLFNIFFLWTMNRFFSRIKKIIRRVGFLLSIVLLCMICSDLLGMHQFIYSQSEILNLSMIGDLFLNFTDNNSLLAINIYRVIIDILLCVILLFLFIFGYKLFKQRQFY